LISGAVGFHSSGLIAAPILYEQVKNLKAIEFKRLCGVTPATFEQMVKVVAAEKVLAKKRMRARRVSRRFSAPSRVVDPVN
jgi:hypothetical protein